jgi:hypothetical protein
MDSRNIAFCGVESYLEGIMNTMRTEGGPEQVLDTQKADAFKQDAINREVFERRGTIVKFDANLDGKITIEDLRAGFRMENQSGENLEKEVQKSLTDYDVNKDGIITFDEINEQLPKNAKIRWEQSDWRRRMIPDLVALSPGHDGRITAAELEALARKAFRTVDKDNNGLISPDELKVAKVAMASEDKTQKP